MKITDLLEDGRIVKGVNTTVDVGVDEIPRQAEKFGNTVDRDGRPPTLTDKVKGKSTNVLYNLGMVKEDATPRYTAAEWAIIEGGHTLEETTPEPKKPGKLFKALSNEAFDTEVDWIKGAAPQGASVYAAKVEDAYIEITYKPTEKGVYISFTRGARMSVTGEGSQNKIFGAVINHIKQWVAQNKPEQIVFSAFKPRTGAFGSQDSTRSGLYRKMVQRFANQNGYDYDVEDTGNEDTFILTRQGVEENFADGKKNEGAEITMWTNPAYQGADVDDKYYKKQPVKIVDVSKLTPFEPANKMDSKDNHDNMMKFIDKIKAGEKIKPIVIVPHEGKLLIVDGHHRYFAHLKAGADKIRAVIADPKDLTWRDDVPESVQENFADGKKPGRKGLAKRSGVNTKASVSSLRKTAKNSSGEKARMAHWLANMKSGRKKK